MRDPCKLRQCFQIPRYFIFAWVGFNLVAFHVIISLYKVTGRTRRRASDLNSLQLYKQNCFLFSSPPPSFAKLITFPVRPGRKVFSDQTALQWCCDAAVEGGAPGPPSSWMSFRCPSPPMTVFQNVVCSVPSSLLSGQWSVSFCCLPPGFRRGGLL